jgi:hypothetical protein
MVPDKGACPNVTALTTLPELFPFHAYIGKFPEGRGGCDAGPPAPAVSVSNVLDTVATEELAKLPRAGTVPTICDFCRTNSV